MYSRRLDTLNGKFERLVESLNQRIRTAVEVNGADGLVSTTVIYFKLRQCRVVVFVVVIVIGLNNL